MLRMSILDWSIDVEMIDVSYVSKIPIRMLQCRCFAFAFICMYRSTSIPSYNIHTEFTRPTFYFTQIHYYYYCFLLIPIYKTHDSERPNNNPNLIALPPHYPIQTNPIRCRMLSGSASQPAPHRNHNHNQRGRKPRCDKGITRRLIRCEVSGRCQARRWVGKHPCRPPILPTAGWPRMLEPKRSRSRSGRS